MTEREILDILNENLDKWKAMFYNKNQKESDTWIFFKTGFLKARDAILRGFEDGRKEQKET